jgi:hypothetical protein
MRDPITVGHGVRHARFGLGAALSSDTRRTTIEFQDHGIKTFVTSMLQVELTDERPARRVGRRTPKTASR